MDMTWLNLAADGISINLNEIVNALVYVGIGVIVFALAFWGMCKIVPFSMQKEIEEDQNTSLGIIVGSVIIGLSIVIGAAIHGGTTIVGPPPVAGPPTVVPVNSGN